MAERVERVSASSKVNYDAGRSFGQRSGYAGSGGGERFQRELRRAIAGESGAKSSGLGDHYIVEVTRPTHSLFYKDHSALSHLKIKYLNND